MCGVEDDGTFAIHDLPPGSYAFEVKSTHTIRYLRWAYYDPSDQSVTVIDSISGAEGLINLEEATSVGDSLYFNITIGRVLLLLIEPSV